MPVLKVTPNLDLWAECIPQERNNDAEYNHLIYKFKKFLNEVKEYQMLHGNCSVTRATGSNNYDNSVEILHHDLNLPQPSAPPLQQQATSINIQQIKKQDTNTSDNNTNHDEQQAKASTSSSDQQHFHKLNGGQNVINLRKRFLLNQESGLPASREQATSHNNNVTRPTQRILLPSSSVDVAGSCRANVNKSMHYNSSHNLVSLNSNATPSTNSNHHQNGSLAEMIKPEIKQRSQPGLNSRLLLSKSSERLDSINNNYRDATSSLENSLEMDLSRATRLPMVRNSRYLQDDDNIYDAVSPDIDVLQDVRRVSLIDSGRVPPPSFRTEVTQDRGDLHQQQPPQPPLPPVPMAINNQQLAPPATQNNSNDRERSNNSISSSAVFDPTKFNRNTNNTSSSLSLVTSLHDQEYGNYVNIDFFLKRSHSPSFEDLDEREDSSKETSEDDDDDDTNTQISNSYSNSQLCDESLKDLSPRELAKKLSSNLAHENTTNSSSSLTPASSGDFLDESRSPTTMQMSTTSSFSKHFDINSCKQGSFFLNASNRGSNSSIQARSSTTPRESTGSRISSMHNHKGLSLIQENQSMSVSSKESSQIYSDSYALNEAQTSMRSFLSDLNLSPVDDVFEDKAQRRIVKESFAVEFCGRRKLRHLFLFNDVIVCAKYQASSKQKFTFDVKWYLNLAGVIVSDVNDVSNQVKIDNEDVENQIIAIRTNLTLLRSRMQQIKRSKDKRPSKIIKKLKKKRTELEAELVLLLPHLPLVIKHTNGKKFLFFLSSNYDRNQWIDSIKYLQSQLPATKSSSSSPSSSELQAWIQTCRKNLNPSLGTFLLRSNCDDDLLYGDLFINLATINGLPKPGYYYFCFEVDSYGHFSQKASSAVLRIDETDQDLNEDYVLSLDGAHSLRILLYEDLGQTLKPSVIGKAKVELSRAWFFDKPVEKVIEFNSNCHALLRLSYANLELLSIRIPHAKLCPTFGLDITQVCKKEKTTVPMLIQLCVNEVERRGMREVGIYRMSGTTTDVQRLKKAFETNPYVAELLLRDIDINSVTGFLKNYLREMPEGLFINKLYLKFVAAFNIPQTESLDRTRKMLELFRKIPLTNQHTIIYLVEHLVKVNKFESYNKMSLTNLATVLGPNILRPPIDSGANESSDPFTAVVIGSMSQAGILYFFLNRRASNLPLTEMDPSELDGVRTTSEA